MGFTGGVISGADDLGNHTATQDLLMGGNAIVNAQRLNLTDATTLTIATGTVARTQSYHLIDTQDAAATDDLVTITGLTQGDLIICGSVSNARDTTFKDLGGGTGQMQLSGDFTLLTTGDKIFLIARVDTAWDEIAASTN